MFLFQKGQTIDNRYMVVFPYEDNSYTETYRVKDLYEDRYMLTLYKATDEYLTFEEKMAPSLYGINCGLSNINGNTYKYIVHYCDSEWQAENDLSLILESIKSLKDRSRFELARSFSLSFPNCCMFSSLDKKARVNFICNLANYWNIDHQVLEFDSFMGNVCQISREIYKNAPIILGIDVVDKLSMGNKMDKGKFGDFVNVVTSCLERGVFCVILAESKEALDREFPRLRRECKITNDLCFYFKKDNQ